MHLLQLTAASRRKLAVWKLLLSYAHWRTKWEKQAYAYSRAKPKSQARFYYERFHGRTEAAITDGNKEGLTVAIFINR